MLLIVFLMNLSSILLIPVILILLASSSSPNPKTCAHAAAANLSDSSTDLQALLSFKSQLSDPHGALLSWNNKSLPHCRWPGVTCSSNTTGRVVALDLDSLALHGTISPYIGNLTFLTRIRLANNSLYGGIPRELGSLSQLQHLKLSMNSFGGSIPATLSQCSLLQKYGMGGQVSTQGDVYSYGVILLQLLTGKKPTDGMFQNGSSLHKYVELALNGDPWEVFDPAFLIEKGENGTVSRVANASYRKRCIISLARLGLLCSKESPKERITMKDVVAQLEAVKEMYSMVDII